MGSMVGGTGALWTGSPDVTTIYATTSAWMWEFDGTSLIARMSYYRWVSNSVRCVKN
jgi:hypothetical protein